MVQQMRQLAPQGKQQPLGRHPLEVSRGRSPHVTLLRACWAKWVLLLLRILRTQSSRHVTQRSQPRRKVLLPTLGWFALHSLNGRALAPRQGGGDYGLIDRRDWEVCHPTLFSATLHTPRGCVLQATQRSSASTFTLWILKLFSCCPVIFQYRPRRMVRRGCACRCLVRCAVIY